MSQISQRIQVARKAAGLTQSQLAKMLSVDVRTISYWENGHQEPQRHLQKLADALKVPADWILSGSDVVAVKNLRTKADVRDALALANGEQISPRVQDLTQEVRAAVEAMLALPLPYRKRAVEVLKMLRTLKADDLKMVLDFIRRLSGKGAR